MMRAHDWRSAIQVPPFRLERYYARHEFQAPHLLSVSDCEPLSVGDLLALEPGSRDALERHGLGYTVSAGSPALRDAIADLYDTVRPDDVIVHAAGEEAIFTFAHAALRSGDHVVVHHPSYQSLAELPRSIGCEVTSWPADRRNGWRLDFDVLERIVRPETRLIVINVPHNPTGYMLRHFEQKRLIEIADGCGAYILSDEVYRGLEYDDADRLPPICDLYPRGVSLGAMSKAFGLAGLRIGWLALHDVALRDRVVTVKDYTTICSSAPSEFLATLALRARDAILTQSRRVLMANRPLLEAFFLRHEEFFDWIPPAAGCVTFPTLRTRAPVDAFCREVLMQTGALLLPGTVFDAGSREIRIGFGRASFLPALERFDAYLRRRQPALCRERGSCGPGI